MDDKKLDEILSKNHAPDIDVNARKRAVNLAVAAFKEEKQKTSSKNFQGISFLSRLISIGNQKRGVKTMNARNKKRFMYGGMATAMAVVLVGGLSLTQLDDTVRRNQAMTKTAETIAPQEGIAEIEEEVSPAYTQAVERDNEVDLERVIIEGGSSIPVPIKIPKEKFKKSYDALNEWRRERESYSDGNIALVGDIAGMDKEQVAEEEIVIGSLAQALASIDEHKTERTRLPKKDLNKSIIVADDIAPTFYKDEGRDKFEDFKINPFKSVVDEPVSTFSSDVDTASYSFIRKQLNSGVLPQKDAVRVEEMVNYFNYNYPVPKNHAEPFKPSVTIIDSPWAEGKKLMHIGIKGYQLDTGELRSNIVFLLDVSGSMNAPDKLPLVKNSMKMLLDSLHKDDTVSIVIYAGQTGVVLEPTKVSERNKIITAMNNLRAGGGTAGAAGIKLAYDMAEQNFDEGAVNRVILATDGDFNVGITNREELQDFVERKRDKGIFLSVLGFGQGNYNDHMMQVLAQNGNGIAAYIDNLNEARKVLVQEATSSLFPIAKDVKFQIEFNPDKVAEYRLIGYETRALKREDFNNDKIDAGDMGAGHSVTAIYEFVPVGSDALSVDKLRYGKVKPEVKGRSDSSEYAFLKIRYKLPKESKSKLITMPVIQAKYKRGDMTDTKFVTAVAAFGQILKGGEYTGDFSYDDVIALAQQGKGADEFGYRAEFINMVRLAKTHSR